MPVPCLSVVDEDVRQAYNQPACLWPRLGVLA
jgi:hypothetical protein